MIQDSFIGVIYGERKRVTRISRIKAKQMYEAGRRIWLQPRLLPFDHETMKPVPISEADGAGDFLTRTVEFIRFYCNKTNGFYPNYYVED